MKLALKGCAIAFAATASLAARGAPDNNKVLTTFQNPLGDLISVPFQNNANFPIGRYSRVQEILNIQLVVPIHLTEDWLLISRWNIPVVISRTWVPPGPGFEGG